MACVGFLLLFGLSCVVYSCEGKVYPPLNKTEIVVLSGVNATLNWTFVGDPLLATRTWYFTRRSAVSNEEEIAYKRRTDNVDILNSSLPRVEVEDPATLVLRNVDKRYNGKYRLIVAVINGGGESSVEFFIAVTPNISVNCSSPTTLTQGDYLACECKGTGGNPPADVTWYKDNTKIVTGKEKAILSLSNVGKDDIRTYRCEAKSGIEEAKNKTSFELIVHLIPRITINCSNVTFVHQSDNFVCECKGTDGNPAADVTWYENDTMIATGKEKAILSLSNVDKDNSGTYRCEAKSSEKAKNETSIDVIVTVTPIVTVDCFSLTTVNQSDNFTCKCKGADGNPPADVTWYKDNTKIATGKEEAILSLSDVDKDDNGTYRCEARSHGRAKNETSVELIVNYSPKNVRLILARSGPSVTMTCTAEARPEPSYKILLNETILVISGKTFIIPEVNSSHVGYYKCVAMNFLGNASSHPKYLSIVTPIITVNCSDISTVHEGDNFRCECKGTNGNPPADVTWYKDNTQIVTGKENAVLSLSNVGIHNNGSYRCEAKSSEKAKNETFLDLIVTITPMISVNCSKVSYVNQSDYFACECNGTDGNPPADLTWYNSSRKIVTGKEKAILVHSNVDKDDNGTYRCEAKSSQRATSKTSIDLFVISTPNIAINCSNPSTVNEGDYFACNCDGTGGNPRANVTWYNSSRPITKGEEKAILRFTNVGKDDNGTYRCEAKSHGKPNITHFYLNVTSSVSTTTTTTTTSTTTREPGGELSVGAIAGIAIGGLALLGIIIFLLYYIKTRKRHGYKGSANVSPDDAEVVVELNENEGFAKGENSYESVKGENSYDSVKGDNNDAYDSVKPSESSASTSKPPEDISPPEDIAPPEANASAVYAAVDKENKQGKTLYATLDSVALSTAGSTKRKEDRPPPSEYADIDIFKTKDSQNTGQAV